MDGDAAKFLAETGLHPVDDVDLVVFAAVNGTKGNALVACEGRFEPQKLAAAAVSRGAEARTASAALALGGSSNAANPAKRNTSASN